MDSKWKVDISTMLDDLKLIHTRDGEDALGIAAKQWQQYQYQFNFNWQPAEPVNNVVVAGMGGSGLAAKAFRSWPGISMPLEIVQDYDLPAYAAKNTLLIASSYSGNTEETVSVLSQALARPEESKPQIIVIASGGKLEETAQARNLPFIKLPGGYQPRYTFGYQLRALCEIYESVMHENTLNQLETAGNWLKDQLPQFDPTIPTKDNLAKQLALETIGKSVVVYASSKFYAAAYKWKISFNENAKTVAWCNQYSEFNHNEFEGWASHPVEKPYSVIDLRSNLDNSQMQKRFLVSEQLLSGKRPAPEVVQLQGGDLLSQMVWAIALGDFVSIYTAILNGIDPTPVDLVEELKRRLV